ncbi:MAG TPA: endonuclease III [Candidatus Coprenecus stercoravium]|uniref:Endonuclease III n=1 Tax=Candidatus Coprenecus stercoravium TaxID=2840735 RepID=A0A9D2GR63_9BACT|nr:endonuclease III [Candidatus Coprenecus stercoravium]
MTLNQRYNAILEWFAANRPAVRSELNFNNGYELIVSVILSAQCTDKRVNMVTPALFERFPAPESLAQATFDEVLGLIKSVSYPNSKAKHLIEMAQKLVSDFHSTIPSDIDALMSLPGVGRKTANVVASVLYNKPVIAVDTHVLRVSNRLGLSDGRTPEKVEADLERHIPVELRAISHHWLILHGRYTCTARAPKCGECPLKQWCRTHSAQSKKSE